MGGNAFQNCQRLSEEAYAELCKKIQETLERLGLECRFPPEIADKKKLVLSKASFAI